MLHNTIVSGGMGASPDILDVSWPSGVVTSNLTTIPPYSCYGRTGITEIHCPNATSLRENAFWNTANTQVTHIYVPNANAANSWANQLFRQNTQLVNLALPSYTSNICGYSFYGCTALQAVDLVTSGLTQTDGFSGCTSLTTIVLRNTSVVTLGATSWFNNTPFKSGGTGGTIYIPKTLYDALGTGANDYKAATNWSVIDGYGTITWAQIEGSVYETQYADGTAVT